MWIDSNAYIGHWPFRKFEYNTLDALLGRMKQFGTDMSLVSNLNGVFYKNPQQANEEIYEELHSKSAYTDYFIPWAVINPIYGGWRQDLETCVTKMGMKGVRLYPKYHGYDLVNPACIELVKMSRDKGLPVAFSLRMVDKRATSWMDLDYEWTLKDVMPIIRAVPDGKFLIVNVANSTALSDEDLALLKKAHLLMDSSGRLPGGGADVLLSKFDELLSTLGVDKFCFGTHSPILDYFTGRLRIESIGAHEIDEAGRERLRSGNIKQLLAS
jgi:predicted TIM-barrel fold metal-dependent hydrolase